jgi:hypothetical protein
MELVAALHGKDYAMVGRAAKLRLVREFFRRFFAAKQGSE